MNGRDASVFSSTTSRSAKGAGRVGHGSNTARLLALGIAACSWAARTCDAQIEVDGYITNSGSNNVSVIRTPGNSVVGPIPVGTTPIGAAETPDGRFAYVTNLADNTVSVIDVATDAVVGSPIQLGPLGIQPGGIAVTPDGSTLYVANRANSNPTGTVSVINVATNTVVASIAVGDQPIGVAVTPDGKFAYVTNSVSNTVSVINVATNSVVGSPIAVGVSPRGVAITPDGKFAYVTNNGTGTVSVINVATNLVVGSPIGVGSGPLGVAITPNGQFAYVTNSNSNTVSVIDVATNLVVGSPIAVGLAPQGVAVTPGGQFVYVANFGSDTVSIINVTTNTVVSGPIAVGLGPVAFGSFLGPNLIVAQGGPLSIANDAALTPLGFGTFVDFNGGTLQTTGSLITARTISLLALGGTIDTNGFNSNFSGNIINSGSLTKIGAGTLTLSGNNTYTGGTNILGGVLSVSSDTNLGTGNIKFGNNAELLTTGATFSSGKAIALGSGGGTLASATGATATYGGVISGTGPLSIGDGINQGTVVLNAANTYSGGTIVLAGRLQAGSAGGFVNNTAYTVNGGTLDLNNFKLTVSSLNGTGGVVNLGSAALTINNTGTDIYSGIIQGTGSLTKIGAGTQTLSGSNSYTGGTNILGGVLSVSSDINLGSGNIGIGNNAELLTTGATFSSGKAIALGDGGGTLASATGATATYGGVISGTGPLSIGDGINQGTVILNAANTYSGGTLLNAGTLVVNNAQALGLGDVVVNGGVLRADPQPINVRGNYTQNAGGTLQLRLGGSAPGQSDLLNVGGHAALDGTLQLLSLNGFQPKIGDKLTLVLAAGGVSGQFANVLDPFSTSLISPELVYFPNSVVLEFASNFTAFAKTPNELAVAAQLDRVAFDPRETQLLSFLQNEPIGNLAADFEKISPDSLSALYEISFSAANVQASNLENRFAEIRNGSTGFASSLNISNSPGAMVEGSNGKAVIEPGKNVLTPSPENKWGVWISGSGEFVNVSSDGNGKGYDFDTGGVSLGLDYRLTKNLAVGIAARYAHTWTNLVGNGNIDVDSGGGGLYATFSQDGFYLNGYAGGTHNSYDTQRDALGGGASGSTSGGEFDGYAGGGYEFHSGGFSFGPIASLEYTYVDVTWVQ